MQVTFWKASALMGSSKLPRGEDVSFEANGIDAIWILESEDWTQKEVFDWYKKEAPKSLTDEKKAQLQDVLQNLNPFHVAVFGEKEDGWDKVQDCFSFNLTLPSRETLEAYLVCLVSTGAKYFHVESLKP